MKSSLHHHQTQQSLQYKSVIRAYSEEIRKHHHSERELTNLYKVWVRVSVKAGAKKKSQ